jgi:REP element-mobilizing transposase RayT
MSRRPRLQFTGALYHVMARGNRKSTIFHDDEDRRQFLCVVSDAARAYDLRIRAACLMGNHYHLVLETPGCNLSDAMHFVNGVFAQRSNRRHGLTGHVFEGRFRSLVIQRESYLMRAARYVVRNPVLAGLVARAGDWRWSSYRATAGLEPAPPWLHVDWIQWAFRASSMDEARERYAKYVNAPPVAQRPIALTGLVVGTKQFERRLLNVVGADQPDRALPPAIRSLNRRPLAELFDRDRIPGPLRDRLIYRARVEHGHRFADIARHLGIDRSTASKAATRCRPAVAEHEDQSS